MRIKRIFSILLMLILSTMLLTSCKMNKKQNVIFVPQMIDNGGYWSGISESLENQIQSKGYEYKMMGSDLWDSKKQAESLMEAVNQKPDAIVLAPIGNTDLFEAIKEANKKNIPIILIDSDIDRDLLASYDIHITTFVGPSNYEGGKMIAERLSKELEKGSDVAIIGGRVDSENGESRCSGFKDEINAQGMNVKAQVSTDWSTAEGYLNAKLILQTYPEVKAIFAVNNNVYKGVEQASDELGISILGGTFDYDDDILNSIESGKLICTFDQNNDGMAESVADVIDKLLSGNTVDEITISEGKVIDKK